MLRVGNWNAWIGEVGKTVDQSFVSDVDQEIVFVQKIGSNDGSFYVGDDEGPTKIPAETEVELEELFAVCGDVGAIGRVQFASVSWAPVGERGRNDRDL